MPVTHGVTGSSPVRTAKVFFRFIKIIGALVQLVRIHACHAWGHGFESRTHRIRHWFSIFYKTSTQFYTRKCKVGCLFWIWILLSRNEFFLQRWIIQERGEFLLPLSEWFPKQSKRLFQCGCCHVAHRQVLLGIKGYTTNRIGRTYRS